MKLKQIFLLLLIMTFLCESASAQQFNTGPFGGARVIATSNIETITAGGGANCHTYTNENC